MVLMPCMQLSCIWYVFSTLCTRVEGEAVCLHDDFLKKISLGEQTYLFFNCYVVLNLSHAICQVSIK